MTSPALRDSLRRLPAISTILADPVILPLLHQIQPELATKIAQRVVDDIRTDILAGAQGVSADDVIPAVARELQSLLAPKLHAVINGTGVIVHTNLGRAPVSLAAAAAMAEAAARYTPLELELTSGRRGGRMAELGRLLGLLTGAEATLVVNNNAAAVLLVLSALCAGRAVVLSRGQAVEIGGGFRVP
ncbi:MAG TPA: L-seryl-tRNA(Sec) selenium transferase, partial [Nitrolancea sp.]|nr:L-seryl-tRNA(Sec) selenium transferase [Nitrolancea sp.]